MVKERFQKVGEWANERNLQANLGTDRLLRPRGERWFCGGGGTILKQAPFLGGKFFSGKKHEGGQIL